MGLISKKQMQEKLSSMTLDELQYALGRYCGPSNIILAEKILGFHPPKSLVEEIIKIKAIEEVLLGNEQN